MRTVLAVTMAAVAVTYGADSDAQRPRMIYGQVAGKSCKTWLADRVANVMQGDTVSGREWFYSDMWLAGYVTGQAATRRHSGYRYGDGMTAFVTSSVANVPTHGLLTPREHSPAACGLHHGKTLTTIHLRDGSPVATGSD